MAKLVDESKTQPCENCEGSGVDPADATPETLQPGEKAFPEATERGAAEIVQRPKEGCSVCSGRGEVLGDDAVILETDDLKKLVKETHKHAGGTTVIVGVDSTELPDIEASTPKG